MTRKLLFGLLVLTLVALPLLSACEAETTPTPTAATPTPTSATPTPTAEANWWDELGEPQYGETLTLATAFYVENWDTVQFVSGEWQLWRIRNALQAFGHCEKDVDGKPLSIGGIAPAIKDYTGYEIHAENDRAYEIVRRFVNGNENKKTGVTERTNPPWVRYAVEFLTHPDVAYLTEHELEVKEADFRAAIHLSQYLYAPNIDQDNEDLITGQQPTYQYEFHRYNNYLNIL